VDKLERETIKRAKNVENFAPKTKSYPQPVDNYVDNFCIKFRLLTFSANLVDKHVDNLPPNAFFGYF